MFVLFKFKSKATAVFSKHHFYFYLITEVYLPMVTTSVIKSHGTSNLNIPKNLVPNFQLCTLMWLHNSQRIYGTDTIRFYKRLGKWSTAILQLRLNRPQVSLCWILHMFKAITTNMNIIFLLKKKVLNATDRNCDWKW